MKPVTDTLHNLLPLSGGAVGITAVEIAQHASLGVQIIIGVLALVAQFRLFFTKKIKTV